MDLYKEIQNKKLQIKEYEKNCDDMPLEEYYEDMFDLYRELSELQEKFIIEIKKEAKEN